ncbi:MAG TPA: hypothetical protein VE288_16810 [Rubrobacteraceae bacterium]|nr:hypothetical protein [Rubrobacteraceae bacterium]
MVLILVAAGIFPLSSVGVEHRAFCGPCLASIGFVNPILAAAAMALSSVTVISNALRLRRVKVS